LYLGTCIGGGNRRSFIQLILLTASWLFVCGVYIGIGGWHNYRSELHALNAAAKDDAPPDPSLEEVEGDDEDRSQFIANFRSFIFYPSIGVYFFSLLISSFLIPLKLGHAERAASLRRGFASARQPALTAGDVFAMVVRGRTILYMSPPRYALSLTWGFRVVKKACVVIGAGCVAWEERATTGAAWRKQQSGIEERAEQD
jgi:hypothetical protein